MSLEQNWIKNIQNLVENNPGQMSQQEYGYVLEKVLERGSCNLLVFGLGKDSFLWQDANKGGKTVFLEHDEHWLKNIATQHSSLSIFKVSYKTKLKDWALDLKIASFEPNVLDLFLPHEVTSVDWDCIIVDAPQAYSDETYGRIQSLYMASKLAYKASKSHNCDIFVHDCDRYAEGIFSHYFLNYINLQAQIGKIRHYQLESHEVPLMKKVIYTAIIDNYDNLPIPLHVNKDYDYILFTNTNVKSDFWKVVKVEGSGVKLARHIKIRPDLWVSDYDFSVWLDGNVIQACDMNNLARLAKYDMMTMQHPKRDCIYQEVLACEQAGKDLRERMDKQVNRYRQDGYPANNGLIASTFIFRYHNQRVRALMEMWDKEVQMFSHRDQLSFNYCLSKKPINLAMLPWSTLRTHFKYLKHKNKWQALCINTTS